MKHALLVDDKNLAREWGRKALIKAGFQQEKIHEAVCGDDAFERYKSLTARGIDFSLVLSDYHMNPDRKHPEGGSRSFRNSHLRSGIALARALQEIAPRQRFCLHSRGMTAQLIQKAAKANIPLTLYKRRPEERKFGAYCEAIRAFTSGSLTKELYDAAFPSNLEACQGVAPITAEIRSINARQALA